MVPYLFSVLSGLNKNILSVPDLQTHGYTVTYFPAETLTIVKGDTVVILRRGPNELYTFTDSTVSPTKEHCTSQIFNSTENSSQHEHSMEKHSCDVASDLTALHYRLGYPQCFINETSTEDHKPSLLPCQSWS